MLNISRFKKQAQVNKTEQVVQFRHKDAQRIASAVHAHESARRGRSPSTLPRAVGGGGGAFATARFTGSWSKDTLKTITFLEDTASTAIASNIFSHIAAPASGQQFRRCAVAIEGTTWILIAAECQ
jgi:hypothetical protein